MTHDACAENLRVIERLRFINALSETKGKIDRRGGQEFFYVLVSAKIATVAE